MKDWKEYQEETALFQFEGFDASTDVTVKDYEPTTTSDKRSGLKSRSGMPLNCSFKNKLSNENKLHKETKRIMKIQQEEAKRMALDYMKKGYH